MEINRTFRLSSGKYMLDIVPKKQLYLHHTVGGSALSTFQYWEGKDNRVGTAFLIERDGTIYEVFSPHYWAWHLGLKTGSNTVANKQSIGIEIASEGMLRSGIELNLSLKAHGQPERFDEDRLYAFDIEPARDYDGVLMLASEWYKKAKKLYSISMDRDKYVDFPSPIGPFRGYTYVDAYDPAQVTATNWLVRELCDEFNIPKKLIGGDLFRFDPTLITGFSGVLTHCNVRNDKSDVCPAWDFTLTEAALNG